LKSQTETERVAQKEPWAQGDIVQIEWPEGSTGPALGIVMNADCDLAHGRTDGVFAIVPVYPFSDYLAKFWAPGHIDDMIASATRSALEVIEDDDTAALHTWLRNDGSEHVATALVASKKLKKNQAEKLERDLGKLVICLDESASLIARFQALCRADSNPAKYARTQITAAKTAMGDGHFFISDLVEHPSVGFVVRMRRIYTLPERDMFQSISNQRSASSGDRPTAVRIARLTELYRVKVVQVFAQQYSRIGLPDEISALGALAIDDLVASLTGASQ
jgi:hypothetical protein